MKIHSTTIFLISLSILFPLIVGLVRHRRIGKTYRPFFSLIILGACAELLDHYLINTIHVSNAVADNIFVLLEWVLICWQFYVWGLNTKKELVLVIFLFPVAIWIVENLVFGHIRDFSPYFRVFDAFLIVMLSVNKINFMITHDDRKLYSNPIFLICIGFIFFFIYRIILEWAYQTSVIGATKTTDIIIMLNAWFNALTNIIFAIALLRIPRPQKFVLQ